MGDKMVIKPLTFVIGQLHGTSQTDCCNYRRNFVDIGNLVSGAGTDFGLSRNGSGSDRASIAESLVLITCGSCRCLE